MKNMYINLSWDENPNAKFWYAQENYEYVKM